ncbi:type I polyketide synthase [Zavarzinella formosa]|uniref:type I polyketide synthase n=1 Tax=Zavarzinella formosa TaxID=360055 RepID=UPI00030DA495|nr:type I polyketide synthase [Zavarzinella formosa]
MSMNEKVAIVGWGGLFPGVDSIEGFWNAVRDGEDLSSEPPPGRWKIPPEQVFDPRSATPDRVHSKRAYFLRPFQTDTSDIDLRGLPLPELDPVFHVALHLCLEAWRSARLSGPINGGVILGNIALPTEKSNDIAREVFGPVLGLDSPSPVNRLNRHTTGLPVHLAAKALGFRQGGYALDAACASSLYAIKLACDELLSGRADVMMAGGMSRPDSLYTQMGFTQLRALSLSGKCSPFDASADGLVVGEGGGAFVLKRISDAIKSGDTIHGVIHGVGLSNDIEGNVLLPASEGQLRAMRTAYRKTGWNPGDVSLIECHATGTPTGDAVEFGSLRELRKNQPGRAVVGCVKSTVGHLLTGAGAAALAKVLLAMKHRTLPPTANFRQPSVKLEYTGDPLRILSQAEEWPSDGPRQAAVSGFGFGGINAHLLVEEWIGNDSGRVSASVPAKPPTGKLAVIGVASRSANSLKEIDFPIQKFRIPPKEAEEILPQQTVMLMTASEALDDCKTAPADHTSDGVFIGVTLDPNTTNFHLRWMKGLQDPAQMDAVHPSLTANRTMGALASIAPSRLARFLRAGGPSFAICDEQNGGVRALFLGASSLIQGEIDRAIVGAVDLASDPRRGGNEDGCAAIVLKRLEDAERDGDTISAIFGLEDISPNREHQADHAAADLLDMVNVCRYFGDPVGEMNGRPAFRIRDTEEGLRTVGIGGEEAAIILTEPPPVKTPRPVKLSTDRDIGLFCLQANSPEDCRYILQEIAQSSANSVRQLSAEIWKKQVKSGSTRLAFVAESMAEVRQIAESASRHLLDKPQTPNRDRFWYSPSPVGGEVAFVYPGSGNQFPDMGRELGVLFPAVLQNQQDRHELLRSQYHADLVWGVDSLEGLSPRDLIFAQVSLGTLVSDVLRAFGLRPNAAIGYSLGESASMYGTGAWQTRDEMFRRMQHSTLFTTDLAGPCDSARQQWGFSANEKVDWAIRVVALPADTVRQKIPAGSRAYVLIVNTPEECVIGGQRSDVEVLLASLGNPVSIPVSGVTTAHCEVALPVYEPYRAIHFLPTTPPEGVRFYSGAEGRAYDLNADSAADAITAAVLNTIDFPKTVQAAYADGVRIFLEIGPGNSCARMIGTILGDHPHLAKAACVARQDPLNQLFGLLASAFAVGVDLDLAPLIPEADKTAVSGPTRKLPVGFHPKPIPVSTPAPKFIPPVAVPMPQVSPTVSMPYADSAFAVLANHQTAIAQAHEAFLRFDTFAQQAFAHTIHQQTALLQQLANGSFPVTADEPITVRTTDEVPRSLTKEECFEFARGKVGAVLGRKFAEIDNFPTRVRLPDGPLMLVDRILTIEGEPLSLTHGRVVTEHDVTADRWYLDNGRIPTCVAVESGQADLFLSGFLGIDFKTRGLACYRLLDATVTFHGPLPVVGDTIRYDIHVDSFFRQGDTYLFRFHFESTVNGRPLMSMREGCAGFFSNEELSGGKGIVHTSLDKKPVPGVKPADWSPPVPLAAESFSANQVDALRAGDLESAFGPTFAGLSLQDPVKLPGGMMKLVHRIERITPGGGKYGLGQIRGEADIHPDDWFLTCHFVDDQVMPGTLMYECCLHTLRVLLMRMGFVAETGDFVCEPLPGVTSRLKCRGQVIATNKLVTYEVSLKEIGFEPSAYVLCDALMYADGKPIVEITNMSLRMTGLTREKFDATWANADKPKKPIFDNDSIMAFAIGKPSEAFGDRYKIFDTERVIARLPGPPYKFLDRITSIKNCAQWVHAAGGEIVAEYDVPPDEWYFAANRCDKMPFSILLEIALQPCGWLAGYLGSALTSPVDISFRNLGGSATQFAEVHPDAGTLTTKVKITNVSSSGGMIIQHYDYDVTCKGKPVYRGNTYFGFFAKEALANQVGLKDTPLMVPGPVELAGWKGPVPGESPFPDPMLKMVDRVEWLADKGGPKNLGSVEGRAKVNPAAWFFKAHFHQDPVWPGSLGLESMIQLMKVFAHRRWGTPANGWQAVALDRPHQWVYRGQILPTDSEVTVQSYVSEIDDSRRLLKCDGLLSVDGRIIYQMKNFTLQG